MINRFLTRTFVLTLVLDLPIAGLLILTSVEDSSGTPPTGNALDSAIGVVFFTLVAAAIPSLFLSFVLVLVGSVLSFTTRGLSLVFIKGLPRGESDSALRRFLRLFLTEEQLENIAGDLAEEYLEVELRFGRRAAKVWYCKQVAASAWPLIRKAVGLGLLASVGEWIRGRM